MTEADWRIKIQRQDRWVMIVILIFTAMSGLLALWVPNLTFGSVGDYITAFLWGFGFQKGLTDLIGKYTLAGKGNSSG